MAVIEPEKAFEGALGKVRRKANKTGNLKSQAKRVAKNSSEVMVKITGFGKGAQHVKSHLDYISRNGKVELETDRGEILEGKAAVKELFKSWSADFGDSKRYKNQRDTMHMVLSMPEGTPQEAVREGARAFAKKTFGANHEYVFALHTDEPHPHVHVTVKMLGFDGRRLNPRKADLQAWREGFAQEMRDQGVEAEATPRAARGVVRKAVRSVIRHIERGDEHRPPRTSRVKASKAREAVDELVAEAKGLPTTEKPWEPRIKARQEATRAAWLAAAAALEQNPTRYKERPNERPDYDHLDARRVRAAQRAAAVYQSNLERSGRKAPAAAIARMRNLSRLDVVQHERPAQVLLHPDAPDRVGRHRTSGDDLRRPRAGFDRATGGAGRLTDVGVSPTSDQALAGQIRGFVKGMPSIDTERHLTKQELAKRFTRQVDRDQAKGADAGTQLPPAPGSGKDVER